MKPDLQRLEKQIAEAKLALASEHYTSTEARGYAVLELEYLEDEYRMRMLEHAVAQMQTQPPTTHALVLQSNIMGTPVAANDDHKIVTAAALQSARRFIRTTVDRRVLAWLRSGKNCPEFSERPILEM